MALEAGMAALAAAGANALVAAMVTDAWDTVRSGFVRVLRIGEPQRAAAFERELIEARGELEKLEGTARQQALRAQEASWHTTLADLLTNQPATGPALSEFLALAASLTQAVPVTQHAVANDNAQQVVQGHGVQEINFGARQQR